MRLLAKWPPGRMAVSGFLDLAPGLHKLTAALAGFLDDHPKSSIVVAVGEDGRPQADDEDCGSCRDDHGRAAEHHSSTPRRPGRCQFHL